MLKIALTLIPKCIKLESIASFGYHIVAIASRTEVEVSPKQDLQIYIYLCALVKDNIISCQPKHPTKCCCSCEQIVFIISTCSVEHIVLFGRLFVEGFSTSSIKPFLRQGSHQNMFFFPGFFVFGEAKALPKRTLHLLVVKS